MTEPATVSADEALKRLKEGNERFIKDAPIHPHSGTPRRQELSTGQSPFAIVLSCADSRLPPEHVFDQGLGDLFVIRVAGNVARDKVTASMEYAVANLGTQLIVVMGHQSCGAVTAALGDQPAPSSHLENLLRCIKPATYAARTMTGDLLDNAVRLNAKMVVEQLKDCHPILAPAVQSAKLRIVPAYYALDGRVEWFD